MDWRERGNEIVDGILFEYFANPIRSIRTYFSDDFANGKKAAARMIALGKLVYDKSGVGKSIQEEAKKEFSKNFPKIEDTKIEQYKYHIWELLDGLKDSEESVDYKFQYNLLLNEILSDYTRFLGLEVIASSKFIKRLNNKEFQEKYQIDYFPDQEFIRLVNSVLGQEDLQEIEELANYVLDKMGGFQIDGWKFRTPAEE